MGKLNGLLMSLHPSPFPSPRRLPAGRQGERDGVRGNLRVNSEKDLDDIGKSFLKNRSGTYRKGGRTLPP